MLEISNCFRQSSVTQQAISIAPIPAQLWLVLWLWTAAAPVLQGAGAAEALQATAGPETKAITVQTNEVVLATADQIHRLSPDEANRARHARIRGVVTCVWPAAGALVVQDSTRGLYVDQFPSSPAEWPQVGDLIDVEGLTSAGEFAPQLHARRVEKLGQGQLPQPVRPSWDQLSNGSLDTQYVEIQGVITSLQPRGLTLLTPGGSLRILTFDADDASRKSSVENALIRMRGVLGASWDANTHRLKIGEVCVFAPEVQVEETPPADLFTAPPKRVSELLLFDPLASALRRVKITGQVIHQGEHGTFLVEGPNGLRIVLKEPIPLEAGDLVEAVGFPSWSGPTPVLREALARKVGKASLPPPLQLPGGRLFSVENDATRVLLDAILLGIAADGRTLELQAGLRRFAATLDASSERLPAIPSGSRLELIGVYSGQGAEFKSDAQFTAFELLIGSPSDIRVLARPSWWTWRRWLSLVATLGAVLAGALIWIRLLHHQVHERTARLQEETRIRERAEHQRAMAQERARIARDLHDDLGSTLTEITMLATPHTGSGADREAPNRLGMIAQRSRTLVHALDEIVWAVDSQRDTVTALARYLASYAEESLSAAHVACRIQMPPSFPEHSVPGQVRHELFLATKETLHNAVRHAKASEVVFRMQFSGDHFEITVIDNGVGFDPAASPDGNGLRNLRERMRALGGRCIIESAPGRGVTVSLQIPLPVPEPIL